MKPVAAALLLAGTAAAQFAIDPPLVLTRLPGSNPAAQLLEVDPTTGLFQTLGRFASDVLAPLAVTIDPVDRSPIVALMSTGTLSRIVRLERFGGSFVEFHVADVPGRVTDLCLPGSDLIAAVDGSNGGLYRMPRRGGVPSQVLAQPNTTAMSLFGGHAALIAWTGRAGTSAVDSGMALVSLNGATLIGPWTFANPSGVELSGVFTIPSFPRQLLSFADGTFARFDGTMGQPQPAVTAPVIPAGGAAAMRAIRNSVLGSAPFVLGGAAFPHLYNVDPMGGPILVRSVALPGSPVDFTAGLERIAHALQFGDRCGPTALFHGQQGAPQPGSTFILTLSGQVSSYAVLAMGLTDFANGMLPAPLPGGCLLEVSPDTAMLLLLGLSGTSSHGISVPPGPAFLGTVVFSQCFHAGPGGISVSNAVASHVGV